MWAINLCKLCVIKNKTKNLRLNWLRGTKLKKLPHHQPFFPKFHFLKIEESPVFFKTFNIITRSIFPWKFHEIPQLNLKIWINSSSVLAILNNFFDFLTFISNKKITSNLLYYFFNICIKIYLYLISFSGNIKEGGQVNISRENYLQKAQPY